MHYRGMLIHHHCIKMQGIAKLAFFGNGLLKRSAAFTDLEFTHLMLVGK